MVEALRGYICAMRLHYTDVHFNNKKQNYSDLAVPIRLAEFYT